MVKGLLVFVGSGLGGLARFGAGELLHRFVSRAFPWATLLVNVVGCFLMGALMYLFAERELLSSNQRYLFMVGVLGGFTTFSSFGWECHALWRDRGPGLAAAYVAASVLLSLAAVVAGRGSARLAGF